MQNESYTLIPPTRDLSGSITVATKLTTPILLEFYNLYKVSNISLFKLVLTWPK